MSYICLATSGMPIPHHILWMLVEFPISRAKACLILGFLLYLSWFVAYYENWHNNYGMGLLYVILQVLIYSPQFSKCDNYNFLTSIKCLFLLLHL